MVAPANDFPFPRTSCACPECVDCCKTQPGSLAPGDLERIAEFLGLSVQEATTFFWSSQGALVLSADGIMRRVRTITPKYVRGRCVFLDRSDRCRIHPVAPVACAYFDTHMSTQEGQRRGLVLVHAQDTPEYQALRQTLDVATHYKPRRY